MARRKRASDSNIGYYAFLLGILIAVIAGLFVAIQHPNFQCGAATDLIAAAENSDITTGTTVLVLVILGLIVGLLNLVEKDVTPFLLAVIALTAVGSTAGGLCYINIIGPYLFYILSYIAAFVAPAAVVVALKVIWDLSTI